MGLLALTFCASFCFIAIKAFQTLNVVHNHYRLVIPTSLAMALFEVTIIASIAHAGFSLPLVLSIGLGSGLGCCIAMVIHGKIRPQEK